MPPPAQPTSSTPSSPSSRPRWLRWLLRLLAWAVGVAAAGAVALALGLAIALAMAYPNLPDISDLADYRPKLPMRVYSAEGALLGEFGEELQVMLIGLFGNQQDKKHRDWTAVGRIEWNGFGETDKGAKGVFEGFDAAVGNGDALSKTGRTELFTGKQTVEDGAAGDAVIVLEQQAGLLERALLAARLEADDDIGRGQ